MILLIDNYDSFTYNLYQYIAELGEEVKVVRNDQISIEEIENENPEAIILSPGPGKPEDAGICIDVVKNFAGRIPLLGICLGHQAIGAAFGGEVIRAGQIKHGKTSRLRLAGDSILAKVAAELEIMRYHSLVIKKNAVPEVLRVTAVAADDEEVMAVEHKQHRVYGLQFHPESIGTEQGKQIMKHFVAEMKKGEPYETSIS